MSLHSPYSMNVLARFAPASPLSGTTRSVPELSHLPRRLSANALTAWPPGRSRGRALRQAGQRLGRFVLESGLPQQLRLILVWALLSFVTAWLGTRALKSGFESSWSEVALEATQHENQELLTRQETLREVTEAALADPADLANVEDTTARRP